MYPGQQPPIGVPPRRSTADSSEDEGEIIEDGELSEEIEGGQPVENQSMSQEIKDAKSVSQKEPNRGQNEEPQGSNSEVERPEGQEPISKDTSAQLGPGKKEGDPTPKESPAETENDLDKRLVASVSTSGDTAAI